ncbi:MAG TPA: tetratricopeptide repeat protein, partial [Rhizobacter sp.]|nr:tetratricopeptide repeat protein [Rhizobacter sp.]
MPAKFPLSHAVRATAAVACALAMAPSAWAQSESAAPFENSALDAPMFYELLIGELEFRSGEVGTAFQVLLDAARKTKDEALFRRATEIALQARAGDQALTAAQAWRTALPDSLDALRYQIQLLIALNRQADTVEPLRSMLQLTPLPERPGMIASLPRLFVRSGDRQQSVKLLEKVLQPSLAAPETRVAAQVALGRASLAAGDAPRALELAQSAYTLDPAAEAPALLALELLSSMPAAEAIVTGHLQAKPASTPIRLTYARVLAGAQRYGDAIPQLEAVTHTEPQLAAPWLTLGALQLELDRPAEATAVLTQYVRQAQNNPVAALVLPDASPEDDEDDNDPPTADQGLTQAYLLLAQAAERQRDYAGAEAWLAKVTNPQRALDVQSRRASMLAKQGKIKEARELIRRSPEKNSEDAR